MHLVMFVKAQQARAGVIDGEDIIDINACDPSLPPTLKGILEANALSRVKKLLKSKKHRLPRQRAKLLPPISNPSLLLSVGMNYHEHLKEMKTPVPEKPAAFTKSVASIIASGAPILLPPAHPDMVDWEGEFTVVMGKAGHRIPAAKALDYVAGYTIVNDVSARNWVMPIFSSTGVIGPIHAWEHNHRLFDFYDKRLGLMDRHGIEVMILSLNAPAIQAVPDAKKATDLARRANDHLAEVVAKRPDRFQGFAALAMQDVDAAIKEYERTIKQLGFRGALVNGFSQISDPDSAVYLDLPHYRPFWAAVQEPGMPFYLHPRNPLPAHSQIYEGHPSLVAPA